MNKKQYNNVIDWTITHDQSAQTEDSLKTARTVFKNMGVALPQGDLKQVSDVLKTDDYMGWRSCTMQEAQAAADRGTAAIGINEEKIVILAANDEEQPVTATASVMTLSDTASASEILGFSFYSYGYGTTNQGGSGSQNSLYFANSNLNVPVGWTGYNQLYGNTESTIYWTSSDTSVASVSYYSGYITAKNAGIATITARSALNSSDFAVFEIWIKGKTPVFLIHGRGSHSKATWGINTNISSGQNNHFDSDINAESLNGMKYTEYNAHFITSFEPNKGDADAERPCNLGNELLSAGYKSNINLFVFNYPNEDAVRYSSQKFKAYIENLVYHVRTFGSDEMKTGFYESRSDYNSNDYKINIIGHSMGGLIARYYIENLYQDNHVEKLITICTPHWGSGYGNLSSFIGTDFHVLCDHDLDFGSAMYGNESETNLHCNAIGAKCYNGSYILTDELLYNRERNTKYYAIAGVDYDAAHVNLNDHTFEMPTNFTNSYAIANYLASKNVYMLGGKDMQIIYKPNVESIGDNMVGFLSQIGWTGDNPYVNTSEPRIQMERIFVDVDTNGGNGGGDFIIEILPDGSNIFHSKVNHRKPVCDQVIQYLEV